MIFKAAMSGGKKRSRRSSGAPNTDSSTPSKDISKSSRGNSSSMKSPMAPGSAQTPTKQRSALSLIDDLQTSGRLLRYYYYSIIYLYVYLDPPPNLQRKASCQVIPPSCTCPQLPKVQAAPPRAHIRNHRAEKPLWVEQRHWI